MNTTLHYSLHQLFCKNTTFTVFVSFPKKTLNFTHSCAFAQIAQFYAVQMVKKQNLTHPRAAKLATLHSGHQASQELPENYYTSANIFV